MHLVVIAIALVLAASVNCGNSHNSGSGHISSGNHEWQHGGNHGLLGGSHGLLGGSHGYNHYGGGFKDRFRAAPFVEGMVIGAPIPFAAGVGVSPVPLVDIFSPVYQPNYAAYSTERYGSLLNNVPSYPAAYSSYPETVSYYASPYERQYERGVAPRVYIEGQGTVPHVYIEGRKYVLESHHHHTSTAQNGTTGSGNATTTTTTPSPTTSTTTSTSAPDNGAGMPGGNGSEGGTQTLSFGYKNFYPTIITEKPIIVDQHYYKPYGHYDSYFYDRKHTQLPRYYPIHAHKLNITVDTNNNMVLSEYKFPHYLHHHHHHGSSNSSSNTTTTTTTPATSSSSTSTPPQTTTVAPGGPGGSQTLRRKSSKLRFRISPDNVLDVSSV